MQVTRRVPFLTRYSSGSHGDANKSSAPPWADEPIENRCVHVFLQAPPSPASVLFSLAYQSTPQFHSVCV